MRIVKFEKTIEGTFGVYDGENGRANYCSCDNCRGGSPVILPEIGQKVFSSGYEPSVAHQAPTTLFLSADRTRGLYVLGTYRPHIPGVLIDRPRPLYKKGGFTHLALVDPPNHGGGLVTDLRDVAEVLSLHDSRAEITARMKVFGLPAEYITELASLIPIKFVKPSFDDFHGVIGQYHSYGDVFVIGNEDVPGLNPSFLRGWKYDKKWESKDPRTQEEKAWDSFMDPGELE